MKRVLCVDYYFPPLAGGWVGGFKYIRLLPQHGWHPVVVSASEDAPYPKDRSLLKYMPPEIEVHRVSPGRPSRPYRLLNRALRCDLRYPDRCCEWFGPALREGRNVARGLTPDLLLSISPSYTSALVARRIRQEFGIPWVAELQDEWMENDYLHVGFGKTWVRNVQRARIRRGEAAIVKEADRVITIHPTHQARLVQAYGVDP